MATTMFGTKTQTWKSKKGFERDLFASYKMFELQPDGLNVPFGSSLFSYQQKNHKVSLPKRASAGLSILDALMMDAIIWHHSFAMLLLNRVKSQSQTFERAIFALHMKIAQDALVVRNLILAGYDVQAKNILRSIDEHVDTVYYLCLKPELASEFVLTNDEKSANEFWWRHIRKSRKVIDVEIAKISGAGGSSEKFSEFKATEREFLSASHHPSYWASTMSFMAPYRSTSFTNHLFGLPSEYSYRTGKFLFYVLAELALCSGILNKEIRECIARAGDDPLQRVVRRGCGHLTNMFVLTIANWNAPVFGFSSAMDKFLAGLGASDAETADMREQESTEGFDTKRSV